MEKTHSIDKVDVEELMEDFRIKDVEALQIYLKELWKDLSQRSDEKVKGINSITFADYYKLPGIILDRLFNLFDKNKNQFLDLDEFIGGMTVLFTENFDTLIKFVFNFYDFNKDGIITKEDIRTVLSYIPLNTNNKYRKDKLKLENEDFNDRVESQDELKTILSQVFENTEKLELKDFIDVIENKCSEVFLFLIIFLLEKRPFSKNTLNAYTGLKKNNLTLKSPSTQSKMIASPSLNSKFSPSLTISKSPSMKKKNLDDVKSGSLGANLSQLNKLSGKPTDDSKSKLLKYANNNPSSNMQNEVVEKDEIIGKNNPIRKKMHNLKNLEDNFKLSATQSTSADITKSPNMSQVRKYEKEGLVNIKTDIADDDENVNEQLEDLKNEGFLYKITNNKKFKKLWFNQIGKDIYCKYQIKFII